MQKKILKLVSLSLSFLLGTILLGGIGFNIYRHLKNLNPSSSVLTSKIQTKSPLIFFALGDTGTGGDKQYAVAEAMEKVCQSLPKLDGIFLLGDNFYYKGVESEKDPQWLTKFEKPYGSRCLKNVAFYPILGNHDYGGSPSAQVAYHKINPRWHMPHRFYELSFAHLLTVTALDSVLLDYCFDASRCSLNFFFKSLWETKTKWHIMLAHHPLTSSSSLGFHYTGEGFHGKLMKPFICAQNITWISGHAHHLEHLEEENCKADFLISGGGGGELKETHIQGKQLPLFLSEEHGFLKIEVTEDNIEFSFYNEEALQKYKFTKR